MTEEDRLDLARYLNYLGAQETENDYYRGVSSAYKEISSVLENWPDDRSDIKFSLKMREETV